LSCFRNRRRLFLVITWNSSLADNHYIANSLNKLVRNNNALSASQNLTQERILSRANTPAMHFSLGQNNLFNITKIITLVSKNLHIVRFGNLLHSEHGQIPP